MAEKPVDILIEGEDNLARFILQVRQRAPWLLPLFHAVKAGLIDMTVTHPGSCVTRDALNRFGHPMLVLVGDDPRTGERSLAPTHFKFLPAAFDWAELAFIHVGTDTGLVYELASVITRLYRQTLFIEATTNNFTGWFDAARTLMRRGTLIVPLPLDFAPVHENKKGEH